MRAIRKGLIEDLEHDPTLVAQHGAIARYDGHHGLGALHAVFCIDRATDLAAEHGVGCVALRRTTHWGRPGNYGWRAAERGFIAICWTNTPANMPAWGSHTRAIGNNPIVFAAPGKDGRHIVLDMAMSQFSFGRLETTRAAGQQLPVIGGADKHEQPTTDPGAILDGGHHWPMGFWKGSGLTIVLDAIAAALADGNDTATLSEKDAEFERREIGVSQVYLAFDPRKLGGKDPAAHTAHTIAFLARVNPDSRYPGQAALRHRAKSEREGIYCQDDIWEALTAPP
jgi:3-dehydro-L-gulonate 2-dehydrogenase